MPLAWPLLLLRLHALPLALPQLPLVLLFLPLVLLPVLVFY
jgi:hypothetical protein